jgi:hypothetical protein
LKGPFNYLKRFGLCSKFRHLLNVYNKKALQQ